MKASTIIYLLATGAAASRCKHRPGSSSAVVPTASASATVSAPVSATATAVPTSDVPATTATSAVPSATPSKAPAGSGIDALFKAKGKQYFGTSADQGSLSIKQVAALMKSDFGQVTPENSMKWDAIEPQKGSFSFTGSDALVKYATENNKIVRGHTLLWYQQLPQWVKSITDKAELTQVLQNHIAKVVGRYKGQIKAWVSHIPGTRFPTVHLVPTTHANMLIGCRQRDLRGGRYHP